MTAEPFTVQADASVEDVATLLVDRDVSRLPVLDGDELVGIVTKSDVLRSIVGDPASDGDSVGVGRDRHCRRSRRTSRRSRRSPSRARVHGRRQGRRLRSRRGSGGARGAWRRRGPPGCGDRRRGGRAARRGHLGADAAALRAARERDPDAARARHRPDGHHARVRGGAGQVGGCARRRGALPPQDRLRDEPHRRSRRGRRGVRRSTSPTSPDWSSRAPSRTSRPRTWPATGRSRGSSSASSARSPRCGPRASNPGIVHAANSPATILYPEAHFDMVRCGIAIYGLHPQPGHRRRDRASTPAMCGQGARHARQAHRHGRRA